MLLQTFQMHYHLREGATFHTIETMQAFLHEIAALGYHVVALTEQEEVYRKGRDFLTGTLATGNDEKKQAESLTTVPENDLEAGVSILLQAEAMQFAADEQRYLWLAAFPSTQDELGSSFSCGITFPAYFKTSSIMITLATIGFASRLAEGLAIFERWLDLFGVMWRVWHPLYAHSFAPHADWLEPADADLQAFRLPYLYEINFLGPEFVDRLGRERVLKTPAWKVRSAGDDSILLVPEFIFTKRESGRGELVAQHLEMSRFFRGEYLPASRHA